MAWDPTLYSAFAEPRLRPALDLIGRIEAEAPRRVVDLGCGTGNVTRILAQRWPAAEVVGIDASPEMLAAAAEGGGTIRWERGDAGAWVPEKPVDVLFSNAALQWLGGHQTLFPRLLGLLAPGGVLAVQMPHNHYAASHTAMADAAAAGPWRDVLGPLAGRFPVGDLSFYYDLLAFGAATLDLWETEYLHVLDGDGPVVKWTMGTALRPLLDAVDEPWKSQFLAEYSARIAERYPRRPDGRTLFPFRRIFMVATAKG
jgi:trans-aconitate 2-methyltransferase